MSRLGWLKQIWRVMSLVVGLALWQMLLCAQAMASDGKRHSELHQLPAMAKTPLISVSNDYPPFYSPQMSEWGVVYHLVEAVFEHAGYPLSHEFYPFIRAQTLIKRELADLIIGVWYRPEREQWIDFSDPLLSVSIRLYKRSDSKIVFRDIKDLKPYLIGIGRGYANPVAFGQANLNTEAASSDAVNLRKLLAGRVDLVLICEDVARYLIERPGSEYNGKLEPVGDPLSVELFHIGVAKHLPNARQILADFNQSLAELHRSGELTKILASHGFEHNAYWQQKSQSSQ